MHRPPYRRAGHAKTSVCQRWRRVIALFMLVFCASASASDELWVENPEQIAFSVGRMTDAAKDLGLHERQIAAWLSESLQRAGLEARAADTEHDPAVLFLDVFVAAGSYYASVGFWRNAEYSLPDGTAASNQVIVWQEYAIGSHNGDIEQVRATISRVIGRFVASYNGANNLDLSHQVAATQ